MQSKKVRKELKVSAIENGTVIDHIPTQSVFQVIRILKLQDYDNQLLIGTNLESQKMGKKGIIKVSNKFFKPEEINKIALVAPTASLIVIHKFKVTEKKLVSIPDEVKNIVKCFNPNCITNHEEMPTSFKVINKDELKLRCRYCEKITAKDNMAFV
jgi:aspartate carbamoyltransferase regulatory subunit